MDEITVENFRCFREKQTARLAPLTLLVGENSTGKTSFLALIKALADVGFGFRIPDFKNAPYDLGSFDEIAHHRGARGSRAEQFKAGLCANVWIGELASYKPWGFDITFGKRGTAPVPLSRRISMDDAWIEDSYVDTGEPVPITAGTRQGEWRLTNSRPSDAIGPFGSWFPPYLFLAADDLEELERETQFAPIHDSPAISSADLSELRSLATTAFKEPRWWLPFASAPVRSKPRRTYDPARPVQDPEGGNIPMYLAELSAQRPREWDAIKGNLESFGRATGLFDEIAIKRLGKRDSEPFQIQIRKSGGKSKGPWRNLIDVGYGVSQVLPVITELVRQDAAEGRFSDTLVRLFLLQQPEVHLHPSAQAALGSLFCQIAGPQRQLIVETHSDHLMDRVRMDIRDSAAKLRPEDVSILFFERGDLDVSIHSLRIDEQGNIRNAPPGYRSFFMEEVTRSLRLRQTAGAV